MATSVVSICNQALSHLGAKRINALTDTNEEARLCSLLYETARDFVLQDYPWGFAERREPLALLDLTPTGYDYAYQYPSDCLLAREIYQESVDSKPIDFIVMSQDSLASQMILTDESDALLVYTGKITNPTMFSPAFVKALSWMLAADLALSIPKSSNKHDHAISVYNIYTGRAKLADANQKKDSREVKNDFIAARA